MTTLLKAVDQSNYSSPPIQVTVDGLVQVLVTGTLGTGVFKEGVVTVSISTDGVKYQTFPGMRFQVPNAIEISLKQGDFVKFTVVDCQSATVEVRQ